MRSIVADGTVMEPSHGEYRNGSDGLVERFGAQVRGDSHLRDIELQAPDHSTECADDGADLYPIQSQLIVVQTAIDDGLGMTVISGCGLQV